MIDLYPKTCNLYQGKVKYAGNDIIYGKKHGSGYCYFCTACKAYVGTHRGNPRKAMGILANEEMRAWKIRCHELFDSFWKEPGHKGKRRRSQLYIRLAGEMRIPAKECHFGYFDLNQLKQAYKIMERWQETELENLEYEVATEPCLSCFLAEWKDIYGVMAYCCDMSHCIKAEDEEIW